jgi:ATP-binding cassette subfamily F protein 3
MWIICRKAEREMGGFRAEGLEKSFGERTIFKEVGLEIRRGDRIGLIGPNGSGKTTLVRCLLGFDRGGGQVSLPPGERVGYVEQEADFGSQSLWQVLLSSCSQLIAWEKRIKELEALISQTRDEAELAGMMREYASLVERFESGGGYQYQNNIRKVAFGLGFAEADLIRAASDRKSVV